MESIPVTPTTPPAPWLGGKSKLAATIVPLIASIPHTTYVEPFFGMGGVFFRRRLKPRAEVINDRSTELFNFFRQLQQHYQALLDCMKWQLTFRSEFDRLVEMDPLKLTELQRAARFIYLQKLAFGGKSDGQAFGVFGERPARFDITNLTDTLEQLHQRLSSVTIENLDWREVLPRYDRPDALFYLDPPYWNCENDYGKGMFARDDFTDMAALLADIQGRFIISLNDVPDVREIFAAFTIRAVSTSYSIAKTSNQRVREVLISNGPLDDPQGDLLGVPGAK